MDLPNKKQSLTDRVVAVVGKAQTAAINAEKGPLYVASNIYVKQALTEAEEATAAWLAAETEETALLALDRCEAFLKVVEETTEGLKELRVVHALEGLQIRINDAKHMEPCTLDVPAIQEAIKNVGALKRQWEANPTDENAQAVVDACQSTRALI